MRIVLLGDIHVYRLWLWPWQLLSKRLLGQVNLWLNRRTHFDMTLAEPLIDHVLALQPDVLLMSGDLTTTALPSEFDLAKKMFAPLIENLDTFITPGNHDRYTFTSARRRYFEHTFGAHSAAQWPHARDLGTSAALIGLDATRPTFINASGRVGEQQLEQFTHKAARTDPNRQLIVMCHYPIGTPHGRKRESRSHRLQDMDDLRHALAATGRPVLYLHGHMHEPWCFRPNDAPDVIAVNAGAPLMRTRRWPFGQGLWQIDLSDGQSSLSHHHMTDNRRWQARDIAIPAEAGTPADIR